MGRGLRSLEQSLKSRGVRPAEGRAPEGASGLSALQEQIEIVRGQRISQPSGSLRALEQRVLGCNVARSAMVPAYPERQTLRLDQEQLAPVQMPYVPDAYPVDVTNTPVTAASYLSHSYSTQGYQSPGYQSPQAYGSQSYTHQNYAPEFSAPDTGRFQVESFADNPFGDDDGGGLTIPAMPAMPTMEEQPRFQVPNQTPSLMPAQRTTGGGNNSAPVFDDSDWIAEAQNERPAKVTAASKKSLNPSLALAKQDFERELAAILGTEAAPSVSAPDPLFNPNAAQQPAPTPAAPAKPAAEPEVIHPNHSVFDQMGLAMRYANSFDLGNVSLKDRFEHFEKDLEVDRSSALRPHTVQAQSMSSPFVDPMNLDEFDLVAELAEIGVNAPAVVSQAPQAQPAVPLVGSPQTGASPQAAESQQPVGSQPIATAPEAVPVKPTAPLDPNSAPNSPSNKPINRTETTAGDDHE